MIGMITDRTQNNVDRRNALAKKGWANMTPEERLEWSGDPLLADGGVNLLPRGTNYADGSSVKYRGNSIIVTSLWDGTYIYATLTRGFNANNGTLIEYTPTLTATTMVTETNGGKCVLNAAKPGAVEGAMGSLYGRYRTFDGLLLQWGTVSITPSEAGKQTSGRVTFAIPFAETPVVFATVVTSVPHSCNIGAARSSVTDPKTQVDIVLTRSDTTTTVVNWFAIGKGAST